MLKSKLSLIIYGILIMVIFASPKEGNAANMSDKDFYDSYNALLAPYASRTIQSKLGPSHQYSLTDAKVIKIDRSPKYTFNFIVVAKYRTYTNAHNPPNHVVTITYNINPSGVKVINFKQKKE
ncbi:DUF3888 domain-containing protein [Bacillus mycoides]|uniref:DUF3888 domain-containing protein n=1 Tax=Bacillus mycoides TaxID=1405 RepID=UPI001FDDA111|nr:DUF3888 domain-containing protein [Bacillus mycoides]CAH2463958.1 Protein of unknown function (DUF3888) [Bacillus mycoides KBAB4]